MFKCPNASGRGHSNVKTTELYDRRGYEVSFSEIEPPIVPDPEFTPFDLKVLRGEDLEGSRAAFGDFIAGELNKINNEGAASAPERENDPGGSGGKYS